MYIKTTHSKDKDYIQIVESYREGDKVKHKVKLNLGRADELALNPSFVKLAERLIEIAKLKPVDEKNDSNIDIRKSSEGEIKNWGWTVYKKIWNMFELNILLKKIKKKKIKYDLNASVFLMCIQHLLNPASKLALYENQNDYINQPEIDLNHLYRSLDILCENKTIIEKHLFEKNKTLFNMSVDIVFYDVTTFYFESFISDELKKNGFSKDCKFKEVQVVLGLAIDIEGRPIGYELFPGNTNDGKTIDKILESLEEKFGIRNIIIVADRGINSKINLKKIKDKKYGYIVASRIKNIADEIKQKIFDSKDYTDINNKIKDNEELNFKYKIIEYENILKEKIIDEKTNEEKTITHTLKENLIITYSKKRADKDAADRLRLIEKAKNLLENQSQIEAQSKRGGKKYLKKEKENQCNWTLDNKLIEADKKFDGYYGIQTSEKNMTAQEIIEAYHKLWKIEESFRIMKSTLETRPIFHWTPKRIKGHFVVCFLSFLLERTLEYELKKNKIDASPEKIKKAINSMTFTKLEINGEIFLVKNKLAEYGSQILKVSKIPAMKNVSVLNELVL